MAARCPFGQPSLQSRIRPGTLFRGRFSSFDFGSDFVSAASIVPVTRPLQGSVRPPGSKSITNRALVLAALADGTSKLHGVLDSQDTRVMVESLRRLAIGVTHD